MLQLTGRLRYRESTPYDFVGGDGSRITGVSHKARVETGRGKFLDVKVRDSDLAAVPDDSGIPEEAGLPVVWEVDVVKGSVVFMRSVDVPAVRRAS